MSETSAITTPLLDALQRCGITAARMQSGRKGKMRLAPAGWPDVVGYLWDGRFFGVETKLSHRDSCGCSSCVEQRAFGARAKAKGCVYVRARSVAEALDGLGLTTRRAG